MSAITSVNMGSWYLTIKRQWQVVLMLPIQVLKTNYYHCDLLGISCGDVKWYTWGLSLNCISLWMADSVGSREAGLYI